MARSKNWRNHPTAFFDIMRGLRDTPGVPVEIPCETLGEARSKRLDFNSFKQGCIEAGFDKSFKWFDENEMHLWMLPQLKVVVRDNPPRMIVSVKDYDADTQAIKDALAKRKQQIETDNAK